MTNDTTPTAGGALAPVSPQHPPHTATATASSLATVEIVIPVYNEEHSLPSCVAAVTSFLATVPWNTRVLIADNASTDRTLDAARALCAADDRVHVLHLDEKGRGRALKKAWLASTADVVVYMDVDLSTDLHALVPLIAPLVSGHSDVSIGSRLAHSAQVTRGPKREFISRTYNRMLRTLLAVDFTDAQCGFKAMRRDAAHAILPHVEDNNWFFDTEMLFLAERAGYRIHEVPVDWVDDPDSRVDIVSTATEDLKGMWRVWLGTLTGRIDVDSFARTPRTTAPISEGHRGLGGQVTRFAVVGVACTIAYAALYLALAQVLSPQAANFFSLALTAVLNTDLNRMFTFGVLTRTTLRRDRLRGLMVFLLCWAVTAGSLLLLHSTHPDASTGVELAVLTVANLVATLLRFTLLKMLFTGLRRAEGGPR